MADTIRATITYKSGRQEVLTGKLRTNGKPYATFEKKLDQYRQFPTVQDIATETY